MTTDPADHSAHYRQSGRADAARIRVPGSGWAWFLALSLALIANYALHKLSMSWWFSYFTGVLPGHDSDGGWWSLGGFAVRCCLAVAVSLTVGAGLSSFTRKVDNRKPVTVWCFRRSAPSLKVGLALLATLVGGILYAAFDAGENPVVDSDLDKLVLALFAVITTAAAGLAVPYFKDLVRVELRSGRAELHTSTKNDPIIELRALAVDRFVVRTAVLSETYFLAGSFSRSAGRLVGAYALEAACTADEDAAPAPVTKDAASSPGDDEMLALPGAVWPWWVGGAAGTGLTYLILRECWASHAARNWSASTVAMSLFAGWVIAALIAWCMPGRRSRHLSDPRPIGFRLLLAGARREQRASTSTRIRTIGLGLVIAAIVALLGVGLFFVVGLFALVFFAPLAVACIVLAYLGLLFALVNAVRVLRDGRTLKLDAAGAWLDGRRVTACEAVGGAVVVYTGLEPTWLRVISMSGDAAQWKSDAHMIASYVQRRIADTAA